MGWPVIPSHLNKEESNFSEFANNNYSLKTGAVVDVTIPTGDPPLPPFPQYTVLVEDKVNGTPVTVPYKNCMLMDLFGSIPDFFEFSLRKNDYSLNQLQNIKAPEKDQLLGATVLIASLNGNTQQSIIIGALRTYNEAHTKTSYVPPTSKDEKYFQFNFNGINLNINDDGELLVQRNGPQDNDGTQLTQNAEGGDYNKDQGGSLINIDQAGGINISAGTNVIDNGQNSKFTPQILLQKSGKITISSGQGDATQEQGSPTNSVVIDTDGSITVTVQSGANLKLQGHANDATLTLGSGTYTVAVAEILQKMYNQLQVQLMNSFNIHTHSTGTGPSGPPLITWAAGSSPINEIINWDSSINSGSMKLPK